MAEIAFTIAPVARHAHEVPDLLAHVFQEPVEPVLDALRAAALLDVELVAVTGDGIVAGYAAAAVATAVSEPERHLSEIYLVAVDEEFQGLGAGRKLVWALIDRLRKHGHQGVFTAGLHGYLGHFGFHPLDARGLTAKAGPLYGLELVDGGFNGLQGAVMLQENPWRR
jgi:predicted N-acetyltransferase YhbS